MSAFKGFPPNNTISPRTYNTARVESKKWNHWLKKHYSTKKSEFICACRQIFVQSFDYTGDCPRCEEKKFNEFYEMIESRIKDNHRCHNCWERLWVHYASGHVSDECLNCPPKPRDVPGYLTTYQAPMGSVPDHIETRDFNAPWLLPHEKYYRLKADVKLKIEDLKFKVMKENPHYLGVKI